MVVRRRHERWPDADRSRITAESFASGEAIAQVARRNGVSLGLMHYWRRTARAIGAVAIASGKQYCCAWMDLEHLVDTSQIERGLSRKERARATFAFDRQRDIASMTPYLWSIRVCIPHLDLSFWL